ncbi:hypothetical protein NA57DRAFT_82286 [Rhizodiscina lignyota]|uniref:L-dopachrome isomerase n=1 Tax=Rhizodiscina lignyota TaxID=1504668 RepID=A0A9P4I484_9PEZI|nr:hypothetical protein NA57DRAFT_82286 [Rhizodiscina lignyota]
MPHSTAISTDTLPSLDSDFDSSPIVVAQAVHKHHSTVLTIPSSKDSMSGNPNPSVFSFEEQPLPTLPTPQDMAGNAKSDPQAGDRSESRGQRSESRGHERTRSRSTPTPNLMGNQPRVIPTAIPYQPQPKPKPHVETEEEFRARRLRHFEDSYASKPNHISGPRERVTRDAPVIAELRTNVIINDEYTLTTDLSYHLSIRFQRPESSIAVTIQHTACLCLGGSFQPAYILTITTLPALLDETINKRNAALLQSFMSECLSVTADRGIVRFVSIAEENLATNGLTILGEIQKLEKQDNEDFSRIHQMRRAISRSRGSLTRRKKSQELNRKASTKTLAVSNPSAQMDAPSTPVPPAPITSRQHKGSDLEPFDTGDGLVINGNGQVVSNNNNATENSPVDSKMSTRDAASPDGRPSSRHKQLPMLPKDMPQIPPPPPIPVDEELKSKKVGKRKSIISIFRGRS